MAKLVALAKKKLFTLNLFGENEWHRCAWVRHTGKGYSQWPAGIFPNVDSCENRRTVLAYTVADPGFAPGRE